MSKKQKITFLGVWLQNDFGFLVMITKSGRGVHWIIFSLVITLSLQFEVLPAMFSFVTLVTLNYQVYFSLLFYLFLFSFDLYVCLSLLNVTLIILKFYVSTL